MNAAVATEKSPLELVPIDSLTSRPPFSTLFPISGQVMAALLVSMKKDGFHHDSPIRVWEHEGERVVVDGHTRLKCAKESGIKSVWIAVVPVSTQEEAFDWAVAEQRD